jgi:hypothetical protein
MIALAVVSSGVATLLRLGERAAHRRFKVPLKVTCDSSLPSTKQSHLGELLCKTSVIIWDEALRQHKHCAEAVSRCSQFLRNNQRPFGDVTMVSQETGHKPCQSSREGVLLI